MPVLLHGYCVETAQCPVARPRVLYTVVSCPEQGRGHRSSHGSKGIGVQNLQRWATLPEPRLRWRGYVPIVDG